MFVCLCVCPPPPKKKLGPKALKLGRRPQNWAEGPKTVQKAPKLGRRLSFGVFGPHIDRDYADLRPASIEWFMNRKVFYLYKICVLVFAEPG